MRSTFFMLMVLPTTARAQVRTCTAFQSDTIRNVGPYEEILRTEVNRHRTHGVVAEGCETHLVLDYVEIEGVGYLTGRIDRQVPQRVRVSRRKAIPDAIEELVTLLLDNDPIRLERDVVRTARLQRAEYALRKRGHNLYGAELFELVMRTGQGPAFLPAVGLRFVREGDQWALAARAWFAFDVSSVDEIQASRRLLHTIGADLEFGYYFAKDAATSFYVAPLVGLQVPTFLVPVGEEFGEGSEEVTDETIGAGGRFGLEMLRVYAMRVHVFASVFVPFGKTNDDEKEILNAYTPSAQVGAGVAF